jgi:hypothetical protein
MVDFNKTILYPYKFR